MKKMVKLHLEEKSLHRAAWGIFLLEIALALSALLFSYIGRSAPFSGWGFRGFSSLFTFPFAIVGLLILSRHPKHAVGWVFLGFGAFSSIQASLFEYMIYGLVLAPGTLPGAEIIAWILNTYWMLLIILMTLLLLLFPHGNLPSPRWRYFIWAVFIGAAVMALLNAFTPGPLDSSFASLENPYSWEFLKGPFAQSVDALTVVVFILSFGFPLVYLIMRIRRSSGQEREQFKWFVFAAALLVATSPTAAFRSVFIQSFFILSMFLMPVAIGIAILRYRLYDIDLIIRRTLAYSVLTGLLALIYFGSVVVLQTGVNTITGQRNATFVTVITTLVIAALFNPLRRRVQDFIDRRFYRKKYNAEQALAQFATTARDEVDMDKLAAALIGVVEETMQPESVSLWLKRTKK
jgi:hypothetical protein